MSLNLPKLVADQTLYSWCGLVHAWNGSSATSTSRSLFGSPYTALMHDFPGLLHHLAERTRGQLGEPRDIALQHTLLGYFLPLVHVDQAEGILQRVFAGTMPELKMKLGIAASRIGGHHHLKGCPECFDDDEETHGFAYWHIDDQLPSAMVCRKHRRPLVIAWDPVTPVHRRGWLLPRSGLKRKWIEVPVLGEEQMDRLTTVAEYSARFAMLAPGSLNPRVLARVYQKALHSKGLATAKGSLRLTALIKATRSHFRGIESVPGFESLQAVTGDWPGLAGALARRRPRPGHPLKHLLLICMLFEAWEEFLEAYEDMLSPIDEGTPTSALGPQVSSIETFRCHVIAGSSIRSASNKAGVCTTTGLKWAKQLGLRYTSRAKVFSDDKKNLARIALMAGADAGAVAEQVGVSQITINRMLSSEPDLKESWCIARFYRSRERTRKHFRALIRENPHLTVKALRQIPGNGYMWLYRHDRAWLADNLPSLWLQIGPTNPD
ncbi:TnsD family Tn7-like transposition protein [Frateuria sp. STR12]|uniref:TnsD family Tn7-like transposition protein n=1 Tax=Frateuria hangzhouensis TaxID=2995589 RepID=UPI002260978E|nr:TnsD family Tn7-like transposition protein [Frateuria sp. STR12]MCX7514988.1 TnsD family Tn7-like transposition protein [Frateuria sp. STR12]